MNAPDKIYVKEFAGEISQMWSGIKATRTTANAQHEYIRKDALLELAKERYKAIENDNQLSELFKQGVLYELHRVIEKIESL